MKQKLLHLLAAVLLGIFLAGLPAIFSIFIMGHFMPGEADDAGFSGVASIVFGVIIYWVSVPIISVLSYFILRKLSNKKGC